MAGFNSLPDQLRRERFFEASPVLKRQFVRPGIRADTADFPASCPPIKRFQHSRFRIPDAIAKE
jgi:hypothetical protein